VWNSITLACIKSIRSDGKMAHSERNDSEELFFSRKAVVVDIVMAIPHTKNTISHEIEHNNQA